MEQREDQSTRSRSTSLMLAAVTSIAGILLFAAIAVQTWNDMNARYQVAAVLNELEPLQDAILAHHEARQVSPDNLSDLGWHGVPRIRGALYGLAAERGAVVIRFTEGRGLSGKRLLIAPRNGGETWNCICGDVAYRYLPVTCRRKYVRSCKSV